jgi:hypothetical protein
MVDAQRTLAPLGGHLVMCVHDELLAVVPKARVTEGVTVMREAMERQSKFLDVPLVASVKIGQTWGDMEVLPAEDLADRPSQLGAQGLGRRRLVRKPVEFPNSIPTTGRRVQVLVRRPR